MMEEPKNETFLLSYMITPLWHKFDVVLLQQNHRQGKDKRYAELLNRARVGKLSSEDEDLLQSRVRVRTILTFPLRP